MNYTIITQDDGSKVIQTTQTFTIDDLTAQRDPFQKQADALNEQIALLQNNIAQFEQKIADAQAALLTIQPQLDDFDAKIAEITPAPQEAIAEPPIAEPPTATPA